jgi:hypothetical protein
VSNALVDEKMKLYPDIQNPDLARSTITEVLNDGFSIKTYQDSLYKEPLAHLETLKNKVLTDFFEELTKTVEKGECKYKADVYTNLGNKVLQLSRLRMVIEPEMKLSINVNSRTKIEYLIVKAYWIADNGKKVRMFSKLVGRLEDFAGGKEDPKAIRIAKTKLVELMYDKYLKTYE